MVLATARPDLVERLIVVDIAPVAYSRDGYLDYVRAMQAVDPAAMHRRAEVDAVLAPSIPDAALRAFLMLNLVSQAGRLRWRLNLAGIAANLPALIGFPVIARPFEGPATFLAGERSDYIRPRDEPGIRRLFPSSRLVEVGDSGHWPHAEHPEQFLKLVRMALTGL
jgi:pimeloyl-ACP methyl ester carboxylesterase